MRANVAARHSLGSVQLLYIATDTRVDRGSFSRDDGPFHAQRWFTGFSEPCIGETLAWCSNHPGWYDLTPSTRGREARRLWARKLRMQHAGLDPDES